MFFKLNLVSVLPSKIAPRELTLSVLACRSELEVAQKVLNFGKLRLNERRAKSIVVQNKAEAPLLYGIQKSGSVASGDLRFDVGRFGVVRPYSSKEVSQSTTKLRKIIRRPLLTLERAVRLHFERFISCFHPALLGSTRKLSRSTTSSTRATFSL